MHRIIGLFLCIATFAATGCMVAKTTVGVQMGSGAVTITSYGDFLYAGPSTAYADNYRGLQELLDQQYITAEATFRETLKQYPGNPDAVYYLGLTLIYLDKRKEGFDTLRTYRDPFKFRVTDQVTWWADYLEKKPELTPRKIHETMNKNRVDAFVKEQREDWEIYRSF